MFNSTETLGTPNHQILVQQGHIVTKIMLNLPYSEKKVYHDTLFSLTFKELQRSFPEATPL